MIRYTILSVTVLILSCLIIPTDLHSQQTNDPEAEYLRIRSVAFQGDYKAAAADARKLVNGYPEYGDARILLGRILAWQKEYKEALAVLDTLLKTDQDNEDALSAKRDISLWLRESTPVSTDIRAGYTFDSFTVPYSRFWQAFKVGAGHRFSFGPAAAALNIGNANITDTSTINKAEVQLEAEAWPTITSKNYAYIAYAYSPGRYFPQHRAALEVWQMLPSGWAVSAGLNYYYFNRNIFISGLSVEKYITKYWFSAKGFFYFKDQGITTSFFANARRYLDDTDYLQAGIGIGTAPDEPFDVQTDVMRLSAYCIKLAYNVSMTHKVSMRAGVGYSREEHAENKWRNRFEANVNFIFALTKDE